MSERVQRITLLLAGMLMLLAAGWRIRDGSWFGMCDLWVAALAFAGLTKPIR